MKKFLFALTVLIFSTGLLFSQEECGFVGNEKSIEYLKSIKNSVITFDDGIVNSIPLSINIIRRDAGIGGISESDVLNAIEEMNSYYVNADIEFFLCTEINYIDSDEYYSFQFSEESALTNTYNIDNTINIYFTNSITNSSGSSFCGYAYYPGGPETIIMRNSCTTNGSTLIHEMGHFFGLLHTHGNSNVSNATNELADGSNGDSAGDYISDTPSDPVLGTSTVNTNCEYTGSFLDNNGQPHNPDPNNIMSYSRKSCRNFFSQEQYNVMRTVSRTSRENLICEDFSVHMVAEYTISCDAPKTIRFNDCSVGVVKTEWDVDGDGVIDYEGKNIEHTYTEEGVYDIFIIGTNAGGETISRVYRDHISIGAPEYDTESVILEVQLDRWEEESWWILKDFNENISIADVLSYSDGDNATPLFYEIDLLPGTCYDFTFYDNFGDGLANGAYYKLTTKEGELIAESGDFDNSESTLFKNTDNSLSIPTQSISSLRLYPNPSNGVVKINKEADWILYDLSGRLLSKGSGKAINLPSESGIYITTLSVNGIKSTHKIVRN